MTNLFNHDEFHAKSFLLPGGIVHHFTFPNGYTASVARNAITYGHEQGLWEIAVMHNGKYIFDTPVTYDVLGWQTPEDVDEVLEQIRNLPPRND